MNHNFRLSLDWALFPIFSGFPQSTNQPLHSRWKSVRHSSYNTKPVTDINCLFRLKVLYKIKFFLNEEVRLRICESLILSRLNFGDVVIGSCLLSSSKRIIQLIHNTCSRFRYKVPSRTYITPKINNAVLLNMQSKRTLHLEGLFHTIVKFKHPSYLYNNIQFEKYK